VDLESTVGGQHLQDQVPIVGHDHKLIQGWPTQDGVEGEADLRDIEDDALRVKVLKHPERNREGDTTTRND
jgi:hypothetical protein